MNDRRFGPDSGPGLTGGVNVGMLGGTRPPMVTGPGGVGLGKMRPGMNTPRIMAAEQVMPYGRAFKKGGMVGCDWSPKSSKTMRGAARKGGK